MFTPTIYVKSVLQILVYAVIVWFLYIIRGLLVYLIIAALIALVAKPIVNLLSRIQVGKFKFPRALAALLVLSGIIALFAVISTFVAPLLLSEFSLLAQINFSNVFDDMLNQVSMMQNWLGSNTIQMASIEDSIRLALSDLLSFKSVESTVSAVLGGLDNMVIAVFSVVFILFFFLKERNITGMILSDYLSKDLSMHISNILPKIKNTLFRYFIGLLAQMTGVFLLVFIGLSLFGVESALLIAVFAAFINLIPYVGPLIGATFGIVLGIGQAIAIDPSVSVGVVLSEIVLVFAITQLTDNFVFQPLIFSNSINAHPLEIFIVISIAGLLGGVLGMIIAVPLYSMIRIVGKEFFSESRFIQSLTKNV